MDRGTMTAIRDQLILMREGLNSSTKQISSLDDSGVMETALKDLRGFLSRCHFLVEMFDAMIPHCSLDRPPDRPPMSPMRLTDPQPHAADEEDDEEEARDGELMYEKVRAMTRTP